MEVLGEGEGEGDFEVSQPVYFRYRHPSESRDLYVGARVVWRRAWEDAVNDRVVLLREPAVPEVQFEGAKIPADGESVSLSDTIRVILRNLAVHTNDPLAAGSYVTLPPGEGEGEGEGAGQGDSRIEVLALIPLAGTYGIEARLRWLGEGGPRRPGSSARDDGGRESGQYSERLDLPQRFPSVRLPGPCRGLSLALGYDSRNRVDVNRFEAHEP